ncbi:MAG: lipocalin-like domain-containing protein [Burkholderiaceae bacterium]
MLAGLAAGWRPAAGQVQRGQLQRGPLLAFARDHGAHPDSRTEWWYATGWLGPGEAPRLGFQLTFFRSRTGLAEGQPSRFAARQLLFAHAAVTDLAAGRHRHAQRIARWSGDDDAPLAAAARADTAVRLGPWSLQREADGRYRARLAGEGFALDLQLQPTQPLLLQGEQGWSRKGPRVQQASRYYSQPQLAVSGAATLEAQRVEGPGRAWLDHEWSDEYLAPDAVGWDWIGINLFDGGALTVFRLRRGDGSALWAGGSFRPAGGAVRAFAPDEVRFTPGRRWASPASAARYPVQWQVDTPAGRFELRALLDAQELDSRGSTGAIYWEGLSELLDAQGRRVGLGYLEMTGYASPLLMR